MFAHNAICLQLLKFYVNTVVGMQDGGTSLDFIDFKIKSLPDSNFHDTTSSRHEKSLGLLTTKFVTLLQDAKDGVLDLKLVSIYHFLIIVTLICKLHQVQT